MDNKIYIKPQKIIIKAESESSLLKNLIQNNIIIPSICGGKGTCGKCKVKFLSNIPAPDAAESKTLSHSEIKQGIRLACRHHIKSDIKIEITDIDQSAKTKIMTDILISSKNFPFQHKEMSPPISLNTIQIKPPSFENPVSDLESFDEALRKKIKRKIIYSQTVLQKLPHVLRNTKENLIDCLCFGETIIDINKSQKNEDPIILGAAVDIGTTTVAVELIDLLSGKSLGYNASLNSQKPYGEDVISRIHQIYTGGDKALSLLQSRITSDINSLVSNLTSKNGYNNNDVYAICAAGNSTMTHILRGISPQNIGFAPYLPAFKHVPPVSAKKTGLNFNSECILFTMPNLGGFVGGDTVSDLLTFKIFSSNKVKVLIDIGTNGEIVVCKGNKALASSAAAGPAFEGARITLGMRGEAGAIEKYYIDDKGNVHIKTIYDKPAVGICGSGLIDIIAELLSTGIINTSGKFNIGNTDIKSRQINKLSPRLTRINGDIAFIVASSKEDKAEKDIILFQKDIRELQLAKSAIATGVQML